MSARASEHDPFGSAPIEQVVPTTEPQREVIAAAAMSDDANTAYNEAVSLRITGAIDVDRVERALRALVDRHDALRSTFTPQLDHLCVTTQNDFVLDRVDLTGVPPASHDVAIRERWHALVSTPMSLQDGPLFRAVWLQLGGDLAELVLLAHHAICDGWSFHVLLAELASLCGPSAPSDIPPAPSFAEFAIGQQADASAERDAAWWTALFADHPDALDLPTDRPRPQARTFSAERLDYVISPATTQALGAAATQLRASSTSLLVAGLAALMQRLTGTADVVLGMPIARQALDDLPGLVGHCVQLLPVRLNVDSATSFEELVRAARSFVLDASEHFDFTFGSLIRRLGYSGDVARVPLIPVLINVDQPMRQLQLGAATATVRSVPRTAEGFELFLNIAPGDSTMVVEATFQSELFRRETVAEWLRALEHLLHSAAAAPATPVADLPLSGPDEGDIHLTGPERDRRQVSWLELLLRVAAERPDAPAVVDDKGVTSYAHLVRRGRALATALAAAGVARGDVVGLATDRSRDLLTAIVGIHLAGAAHLPLDPGYPGARLQHMVVDSGARLLVVDRDPPTELAALNVGVLDLRSLTDLDSAAEQTEVGHARADDLAYIIYTSGSTGLPKGVRVSHGNLVNLLAAVADRPGFGADDVLLAVTTISFDISLLELLLPLTVGGRLVVARREDAEDPRVLAHLLERQGATVMQATPATWRMLLEHGWQGSASLTAFCGGERLPPDLAEKLLPRVRALWNLYGPTETTIWSATAAVEAAADASHVGTPLDNTVVCMLDQRGIALPRGVPGEICIGGAGVAQGYHDRPELTAERFVEHVRLGRLYRTGDRGRIRFDGMIECFGRLDHQVKLRGFRIELGEIEVALMSHPDMADAVVVVRDDRDMGPRLVAYVVTRSSSVDGEVLREHLRRSLPDYMVPQQVVSLAALPRLPNGKLDRDALPAVAALDGAAMDESPPQGELETLVSDAMAALLGLNRIGAEQDFFAAGGHSLLAAQLVARLNRRKACDLTMRSVFQAPTPRRLALAMTASVGSTVEVAAIPRRADRTTAPVTLVQERIWFLEQMLDGRPTYNLPSAHRLRGAFDRAAFVRALEEVVRRQAVLRTTFERRDGVLIQIVHEPARVELPATEDLSALPAEERCERLMARLDELTAQPFDLARLPLYRAHLFRLDAREHVFFFMPHHIIWDGWSFDVLYRELSQQYASFAAGRQSPLPQLPIEYGDYAAWQRERQRAPAMRAQLDVWRGRFERFGTILALPGDRHRTGGMSGVGSTEWVTIDAATTQALHAFGRDRGATLFATVLAVYCVLLREWSREAKLLLATPVRGRESLELEPLMGCCNSLMPLIVEFEQADTFDDLLSRVRASVMESLSSPDLMLEQIVEECATGGGNVLYQALFSFQDVRQRELSWGALSHEMIPLFQRGSTEDLGLWFVEGPGGLQGGLTFNVDVFSPGTAARFARRFEQLVDLLLESPAIRLAEIVDEGFHVDRVAAPDVKAGKPRGQLVEARNDYELLLARIWADVLKVDHVGIHDNFFDLGGSSLSAIRCVNEFEATTGLTLNLGEIFRSPTIAELVAVLASGRQDARRLVIPLQAAGNGPPVFCLLGIWVYHHLARELGTAHPTYGVYVAEEQAMIGSAARARDGVSLDRLASAYVDVLREARSEGPLRLLGLSFGGIVAIEVARRLIAAGREVEHVVLIDTVLPTGYQWTGWRALAANARAALRSLGGWFARRAEPVGGPDPDSAAARAQREREVQRWLANQSGASMPARVTLVRASDQSCWGPGLRLADDYGWRAVIGDHLDVMTVDGDHVGMLSPPFVKQFARDLGALLNGAGGEAQRL